MSKQKKEKIQEDKSKEKEQDTTPSNQSQRKKYIVLDVVFYGSSLNYDQGVGNYQELKKITKWDGKQYTLVSRYALRYSILETAKNLGLWKLADASHLQRAGEGEKTVIQPSVDILLSGEILTYPEFDLFGYLITNTNPQNAREAPVKISHAVSLTPYTYDSHFCGNLGLAKRMIKSTGKVDPNLFTVEEHQTYYIYTVVIDVDRIGKNEVYLSKKEDKDKNKWKVEIKEEGGKYKIEIKTNKTANIYEIEKINNNGVKITKTELGNIYLLTQTLTDKDNKVKERITQLIKAILYLNRNIKGRNETLHPKLLIVGLYNGTPYKSYKDRIMLTDEYEEVFEEKKETTENNDEIRVIRRIVKLRKPTFLLRGVSEKELKSIDKAEGTLIGNSVSEKELESIDKSKSNNELESIDKAENTDNNNSVISKFLNSNNNTSELYIFKAPEIEVRFEEKHDQKNTSP
jgi:CRISPR-associated protein Cst2